MDLKWKPGRVSHPASAAVRVSDVSWRSNVNPSPLIKDDGELLMDEYLSPRKLKVLTGVDDLQQVKALEMQVDTRESSLGSFGAYLPNLRELKLNNSLLVSVRDLGTTLSHVRVLWMARCGLSDLDGISSCGSLKELYIAYNSISDLSQLTWLDHLEVLDLEGNDIEDINQMQYLGLCGKLSRLTVEGNLICLKPSAQSAEVKNKKHCWDIKTSVLACAEKDPDYNYRAEVKKLIPQLEYLDEIPASQTALPPAKKMPEDWLIIKESIKGGGLAGDISRLDPCLGAAARQPGCGPRPPTASRPGTTQWSASAGRSSNAHLFQVLQCHLPGPTASDELFTEDVSSDLTHGLSQVICGNPTKALRARRQKLGPPVACGVRMENLYGSGGEGEDLHQEDVLEQHKRYLQTGQQEKATQALKVTLGDEEEGGDGGDCSLTHSYEETLKETSDEDLTERISLDSSCHSCLSQTSSGSSQAWEGAVFSNLNHCLIPSPPKSPSPASITGVAARPRKIRSHRVQCLKTPSQEEERQQAWECQSRTHQEASAQPLGKDLALLSQHSIPPASRSRGQGQPVQGFAQQTPGSGPAAVGSSSRPIMDESLPGDINCQQPAVRSSTEASERFGLMKTIWPLTARAVLQSLPDRPTASTPPHNRRLPF